MTGGKETYRNVALEKLNARGVWLQWERLLDLRAPLALALVAVADGGIPNRIILCRERLLINAGEVFYVSWSLRYILGTGSKPSLLLIKLIVSWLTGGPTHARRSVAAASAAAAKSARAESESWTMVTSLLLRIFWSKWILEFF